MSTTLQLPTEIILNIFQFLELKDLTIASKVNRLWNQISNDKSLWKVTKLKTPMKLNQLKKFIYHNPAIHFLERLEIKSDIRKYDKKSITNASLKLLGEKTQIKCLILYDYNLDEINIEAFPKTLEYLALFRCKTLIGFFDNIIVLKKLRALDLTESSAVTNKSIASISSQTNLEQFSVAGCYRLILSNELMKSILENVTKLSICYQDNIEIIINLLVGCRQLSNLKYLCMSNVIFDYLPIYLQVLEFEGSYSKNQLSVNCGTNIKPLAAMKELKVLRFNNIQLCSMEETLHSYLPVGCILKNDCEIIKMEAIFDKYKEFN